MPKARYSDAAILPNFCNKSGSKVAAIPRELGHIEIAPPAAASNSALATVACRGSELLFAGMPNPTLSQYACNLLFHCAAISGDCTVVIKTCLKLSSFKNFFC
jgi:hypothetical protein